MLSLRRLAVVLVASSIACESTAPDVVGSYSLTAKNASVFPGGIGSSSVTIDRAGGFAQKVDLTVTGLPAGVTASFDPSSASATSSVLTFTASAGAAVGATTVTVRGVSAGLSDQATTLKLSVQPPTAISMHYCQASLANFVWFGYQNEDADWVRAFPDADGTVSFVATPKVAFAYVQGVPATGPTAHFSTRVQYLTAAELKKLGAATCPGFPAADRQVTITGQASLAEHTAVWLWQTAAVKSASGATTGSWPVGITDLVAIHEFEGSGASSSFWNADRIAIRRAVDPATSLSFDVTSAEFVVPTAIHYSVAGLAAGETPSASLQVYTHAIVDNTIMTRGLLWKTRATPATTGTIPAVPASLLTETDLHEFTFGAVDTIGSDIFTRAVISTFRTPVDQALTLGAPLVAPEFTKLTSTGAVRYRVRLPSQSDYAAFISFRFATSGPLAGANSIAVDYTAGYAGGTPPAWDVSMPDLTSAAGWDGTWNVQFGVTGVLTLTAFSEAVLDYTFYSRRQWALGVSHTATFRTEGVVP